MQIYSHGLCSRRQLLATSCGLVALLLAGCMLLPIPIPAPVPVTATTTPAVALGKPFELALGASAEVGGADLSLTFVALEEDSRCPRLVSCVWIGRAVVALAVEAGGTATEVTLMTKHSPDPTDIAAINGYEVHLIDVQPYPQHPDRPIAESEYTVRLVVTEASPSP